MAPVDRLPGVLGHNHSNKSWPRSAREDLRSEKVACFCKSGSYAVGGTIIAVLLPEHAPMQVQCAYLARQ
jgi:hypothetical protein